MHSYQFLDDIAVADLAFKAEGDSVEELFHAATEALLETLADPATVAMTWERRIEHVCGALDELLFEWLSDLVYWKDAAGWCFTKQTFPWFRKAPHGRLLLSCEALPWIRQLRYSTMM